MTKYCIVPFCRNRGKIPGIKYYRITSRRRESWLKALGRNPDDNICRDSFVCSRHFQQDQISEDGCLLPLAIPSLNLRPSKCERGIARESTSSKSARVSLQKEKSKRKLEEAFSSCTSADSVGLTGNMKNRCKIIKQEHSYSTSPQKMKESLIASAEKMKIMQKRLRNANLKISRLQDKVDHLNDHICTIGQLGQRYTDNILRSVLPSYQLSDNPV